MATKYLFQEIGGTSAGKFNCDADFFGLGRCEDASKGVWLVMRADGWLGAGVSGGLQAPQRPDRARIGC